MSKKKKNSSLKKEYILKDDYVDVSTFPPNTMTDKEFEEYRKKIRQGNTEKKRRKDLFIDDIPYDYYGPPENILSPEELEEEIMKIRQRNETTNNNR